MVDSPHRERCGAVANRTEISVESHIARLAAVISLLLGAPMPAPEG